MGSNKVAVITGASSGIGLATARIFMAQGMKVYNLSRTPAAGNTIMNIRCDVGEEESVRLAFAEIEKNEGKIDILVLNAGYGISGAAETTMTADSIAQFNVNFFGAARCVRYAGALLRKSPNPGRIIFISSLAAIFPIPFQAYYSASKAAILSYSRALSMEMRPFGIKVVSVLPGDVRTDFTRRRSKNPADGLYDGPAFRAVAVMEKDERNGMAPEKIARSINKIAKKRRLRPYYAVGAGYKILAFLARILPPSLVDRIIRRLYS